MNKIVIAEEDELDAMGQPYAYLYRELTNNQRNRLIQKYGKFPPVDEMKKSLNIRAWQKETGKRYKGANVL